MVSGVLLAAQLVFVGIVVGRLTPWIVDESRDWYDRLLVGVVVALVDVELTLQLLGAVHLLSRGWVVATHAAGAAVVVAKVPAGRVRQPSAAARDIGTLVIAALGLV